MSRRTTLVLEVNAAERARWKRLADELGLSLRDYVRATMNHTADVVDRYSGRYRASFARRRATGDRPRSRSTPGRY